MNSYVIKFHFYPFPGQCQAVQRLFLDHEEAVIGVWPDDRHHDPRHPPRIPLHHGEGGDQQLQKSAAEGAV